MEKNKLIEARNRKGFTQKQVAEKLFMDVSSYNRREKGKIKINNQEWIKLSNLLETTLENIYESEDSMIFIHKDNVSENYQTNNRIYSIPEYFLENQRKYIEKLEIEIEQLKRK